MKRPKPQYPSTWKAFSRSIRSERAQGRCECVGECGLHCTHPGPRRCVERDRQPARWAQGIVVLTVAHLCSCTPPCVEETHVKACCNRCHLRIDIDLHRHHRAEAMDKQYSEAGQIVLFDMSLLPRRVVLLSNGQKLIASVQELGLLGRDIASDRGT